MQSNIHASSRSSHSLHFGCCGKQTTDITSHHTSSALHYCFWHKELQILYTLNTGETLNFAVKDSARHLDCFAGLKAQSLNAATRGFIRQSSLAIAQQPRVAHIGEEVFKRKTTLVPIFLKFASACSNT